MTLRPSACPPRGSCSPSLPQRPCPCSTHHCATLEHTQHTTSAPPLAVEHPEPPSVCSVPQPVTATPPSSLTALPTRPVGALTTQSAHHQAASGAYMPAPRPPSHDAPSPPTPLPPTSRHPPSRIPSSHHPPHSRDRSRHAHRRHDDDDEGDRIGPYSIAEEIGRGSFATVYRGERQVRALLRASLVPIPPRQITCMATVTSPLALASPTRELRTALTHRPTHLLPLGHARRRGHQVGHQEQAHDKAAREPRE